MRFKQIWIGIGLAAVGLVTVPLLRKGRLAKPWSVWLPVLQARRGEEEGRALTLKARRAFDELLASYPRPLPAQPLRAHLVDNILPGLALYRVLLEAHGGDREAALAEIEPLFQTWTRDLYAGTMALFRRLPFTFWFFRLGLNYRMKAFPDRVWQTNWIENSPRRIAFDNFACPYLETLAKYEVPELTPYFCQIDDWMGEMLPRAVAFRRSQTLARGGDRCDFRYERVD